jgi:hypothetical protein
MTRRAKEQRQKRLLQKLAKETPEEIARRENWQNLIDTLDTSSVSTTSEIASGHDIGTRGKNEPESALEVLHWKSSHAVVAAGGNFVLPIRVECPQSRVVYEFETKEWNIFFSIGFFQDRVPHKHDEHQSMPLFGPVRCDSHEHPVKGSHEIDGPGTIVFSWDNAFSWFNPKELRYRIELHQTTVVPRSSMNTKSTPVSSSRSVNASTMYHHRHQPLLQEALTQRQFAWKEKSNALQSLQSIVKDHEIAMEALEAEIVVLTDIYIYTVV